MLDVIRKILFILPDSDRWKLIGLVVLMLIGSILEVVGISMLPIFISIVASPGRVLEIEFIQPLLRYFQIDDGGDLLVFGGVLLVGIFLIKNVYLIGFRYLESRYLSRRFAMMASCLFNRYMNSEYTFITSRNTSEILRNITQETGIVVKHVMEPILKLTMDGILIVATLSLLLFVSPLITLVAVLLFALAGGGFLKVLRGRVQMHGKRAQAERMVMIQTVSEGLAGLKDIRVLQRANLFLTRFKMSAGRYAEALVFRTMTKHATKPVLEIVAVTGMMLIALVLYWTGAPVETIVPLLALFGAAAIRLLPTMREVVEAINSLRFYGYAVHPVYEEFKRVEGSREISATFGDANEQVALPFEREIRFEGVSFAYPARERPAVNDLSLRIGKGEAVGFIGSSGAGKTTLVDLVLGILEPQDGKITVDGVDIKGKRGGWLRNVGYIPQFIFLADDTLKRNIALGLPDEEIEEDRLREAIEAAQLSETIKGLPEGTETCVGERGVRLSGGQRQRIGIARALYANPSVLIMDEATSSLDPETEKYVIESIDRLKGKRTILMISHRLTTVQNCDRLFVIDRGRVADSGRFEEIIGRNAVLCQSG